MKIVINNDYEGFSLSEEAILRYYELKGKKIYTRKGDCGLTKYYLVSPEEYDKIYELDKKLKNYTKSNNLYISPYRFERTDKTLIQVIEELGEKANGKHAHLKIVEIPDGIEYEIEDYDGVETIHEKHRSWR
jgi:hypothetical protein